MLVLSDLYFLYMDRIEDSALLQENIGQRKPLFWYNFCSEIFDISMFFTKISGYKNIEVSELSAVTLPLNLGNIQRHNTLAKQYCKMT